MSLIDGIKNLIRSVTNLGTSFQFVPIIPHDENDLPNLPKYRAIYVGGEGNLKVLDYQDREVTFTGVSAGTTLIISPKRIFDTDTTATELIGLI